MSSNNIDYKEKWVALVLFRRADNIKISWLTKKPIVKKEWVPTLVVDKYGALMLFDSKSSARNHVRNNIEPPEKCATNLILLKAEEEDFEY